MKDAGNIMHLISDLTFDTSWLNHFIHFWQWIWKYHFLFLFDEFFCHTFSPHTLISLFLFVCLSLSFFLFYFLHLQFIFIIISFSFTLSFLSFLSYFCFCLFLVSISFNISLSIASTYCHLISVGVIFTSIANIRLWLLSFFKFNFPESITVSHFFECHVPSGHRSWLSRDVFSLLSVNYLRKILEKRWTHDFPKSCSAKVNTAD